MRIINPSTEIMSFTPNMEKIIELAIRNCYKSEDRITDDSADKIIDNIMSKHHESTIEHALITVRFINDRGVSHEQVRHRLSSFSQESTRYCSYNKDKFGNQITVIDIATGFNYNLTNQSDLDKYNVWRQAMSDCEKHYFRLLELGATAQEARSVLPNSLKTELVWSANPREWRHIFEQRTSDSAHPQIAEVMVPLLIEFKQKWPVLFSNITHSRKWDRFLE